MVGRTCAGVGSALIAMFTMLLVGTLGGSSERTGFRYVALIVSGIFVVTEIICCANVKENAPTEMKTATVKEMFSALFRNDQAMVVVATIVLINSALYLTSNFIIYFFKYDFGGEGWKGSYTLFSTIGGAAQILGMMVLYPLLRKKLSSTGVFRLSVIAALAGYGLLLVFCLTGLSGNLVALLVPGIVVFACNGMLSVLTTLFLSNSVDYGQLKTGRREESVIFSMQTFVVKAASGVGAVSSVLPTRPMRSRPMPVRNTAPYSRTARYSRSFGGRSGYKSSNSCDETNVMSSGSSGLMCG